MAYDPASRRIDPQEPSLGELLGGLVGNMQDLIRGEVALAKREVKEEATKAGAGAGLLAGAGALALVGLIFVGLTLTYALTLVLPSWAAALIVAALFFIVGFVLYRLGRERLQRVDPVPRQTIESLKEDTEWIKRQVSSDES
jgi:uncharacterized membrane protein YqjE